MLTAERRAWRQSTGPKVVGDQSMDRMSAPISPPPAMKPVSTGVSEASNGMPACRSNSRSLAFSSAGSRSAPSARTNGNTLSDTGPGQVRLDGDDVSIVPDTPETKAEPAVASSFLLGRRRPCRALCPPSGRPSSGRQPRDCRLSPAGRRVPLRSGRTPSFTRCLRSFGRAKLRADRLSSLYD